MRRTAGVLILFSGLAYFGLTVLGIYLLSRASGFDPVGSLLFLGPNAVGAVGGLGAGVSLLRGPRAGVTNFSLLATGLVVVVSVVIATITGPELQLTYAALGVLALLAGALILFERRQTSAVDGQ